MLTFFELSSGSLVRADQIHSFGPAHKREGRWGSASMRRVSYGDGGSDHVFETEIDQFLMRPVQLMPAVPGTTLLYIGTDEQEPWISRTPLIAWALCIDGHIRPVTPAGVNDDVSEPDQGWWVEMPGGELLAVDGIFDIGRAGSEAELLAWARGYCKQRDPAPEGEA